MFTDADVVVATRAIYWAQVGYSNGDWSTLPPAVVGYYGALAKAALEAIEQDRKDRETKSEK